MEVDEVLFGEVFATVGKFVLHQTEVVAQVHQQPTVTPESLMQKLDDVTGLEPRLTYRSHSIVMIFTGDFDLEFAYAIVAEKFAKHQD